MNRPDMPLDHVIALLRPQAALSKPITGCGEWGVCYDAWEWPSFSIVLRGACWLALGDAEPIRLERGDFLFQPGSPPFAMFSHPGVACKPGSPSAAPQHHGAPCDVPDFEMLGGTFRVEPENAALVRVLLPAVLHIRAKDCNTARLERVIALILEEGASDLPGRDMVLARFIEVMLVETLRADRMAAMPRQTGLLRALHDRRLAIALRAIHGDLARSWTVGELARLAGMSRSSFAAHFTETLGDAPMTYLARWRMTLAQSALRRGDTPLESIARDVGYQSASAFSTAFRKAVGCAPRSFARQIA